MIEDSILASTVAPFPVHSQGRRFYHAVSPGDLDKRATYGKIMEIVRGNLRQSGSTQRSAPDQSLKNAIMYLRQLCPRGTTLRPKAKYRSLVPARWPAPASSASFSFQRP